MGADCSAAHFIRPKEVAMKMILYRSLLLFILVLVPGPFAMACGEGMFNSGKGLPFQSYLAPRPADVLVLAESEAAFGNALYTGLENAGHRIVVVTSTEALQREMRQHRFDIVISSLRDVDQVLAGSDELESIPKLLPVVARNERNTPAVRGRFDLFVLDGASLGQHLSVINRALSGR
jgi:hypothetical protein